MIRKTIAVAMVVAMCATALSQTTDKGKKLIGKYPAADRDRDGVLSEQELLDLKKSVRKSGGVSAPGKNAPAEAPATRPTKEQKAEKRLAKLRVPMTFTDVAYGPLERNRLDFWKAESKGPTPVMVLIHA